MPRINIEDSLFLDQRFYNLSHKLGSLEAALGAIVLAWKVAQRFYIKPDKFIPMTEWVKNNLKMEIIDCGLAKIHGDFVRMSGTDDHFKWLQQRVEAGRKGGQANAKRMEADVSKNRSDRIASYSSSYKEEKTETILCAKAHQYDLEKLYQEYPIRDGGNNKKQAISKLDKLIKSVDTYSTIMVGIQNYKKYCDRLGFTKTEKVMMFKTFVNNESWNEYQKTDQSIGYRDPKAESKSRYERLCGAPTP